MYEIRDSHVYWKGRRLIANAATFEVLGDIVAIDQETVFVLGKPFNADRASFRVLSGSYAADQKSVYSILDTKLKPLKKADPSSFQALGQRYGRDDKNAFYLESCLRSVKLDSFRVLGADHAIDAARLYCGSERKELPQGINTEQAQLRVLEDSWMALALGDEESVWVSAFLAGYEWCRCDGASFQNLRFLGRLFHADDDRVWFAGTHLEGANPKTARAIAKLTLVDDSHVWLRDQPLDVSPDAVAAIDIGHFNGDVIHYEGRLALHNVDGTIQTLATARKPEPFDATATLRPIFGALWQVFDRYLPIHTAPSDMEIPFERNESPQEPWPTFTTTLHEDGELEVTLEARRFRAHVTAWYTLGCHVYCAMRNRPLECTYYPSVGRMLPDGQRLHQKIIQHQIGAFSRLICECQRLELRQATELLAHMTLSRALKYYQAESEDDPVLAAVASLPGTLMVESEYVPRHYEFESTTNLSVARFIVREGLLRSPNFRDRLDVCGVLHGTVLETNKTAHFFKDVIPAVMERYDEEELPGVREMLGAVLEAALIKGQVDAEVSQKYHYQALLPVIEFCIARGLGVRFNRARRVDTLWALGRDDEAQEEEIQWLQEFGDDTWLPGIYCNRHAYRSARIWFLRGRVDSAWQKGKPEIHQSRLSRLENAYARLVEDLGPASVDWPEMKALADDLARYREALED